MSCIKCLAQNSLLSLVSETFGFSYMAAGYKKKKESNIKTFRFREQKGNVRTFSTQRVAGQKEGQTDHYRADSICWVKYKSEGAKGKEKMLTMTTDLSP